MTYNLSKKGEQVRIGNWFEELRLQKETGIRFYPDPRDAKSRALTYYRCIEHTDQIRAKDYKSVTSETIVDPRKHPNYRTANQINSKGPRQLRLEQSLMDEVAEETKSRAASAHTAKMQVNYQTEMGSMYQGPFSPDASGFGNTGGTRRLTPGSGTATLRDSYQASSEEMPITYYSHAVKTPGAPVSFPTTFVGATNTFKKSGAFSADVEHNVLAVRSESYERPKSYPNVLQYRDINEFKRKLLVAAEDTVCDKLYADQKGEKTIDGRVVRDIVDTLWMSSKNGYITGVDLMNAFDSAYNLRMNAVELRGFVAAFDTKSLNAKSEPLLNSLDIQGFLRGQPSAERMEAINMVFRSMDPEETNTFFCDPKLFANAALVTAFLHATGILAGKGTEPRDVAIDEFFDFYYDASAEIGPDRDDLFEQLLYRTWAEGN